MKKNILQFLLVTGAGAAMFITGCSKDDTTAPVVTLNGASSIELSLNSGTWTDLGATATDDADGTISSVTSDASSSNPNTNMVGFYTVTYSATDKAGNVGTATRSIYVKNDADDYAGTYTVHDSVAGLPAFPDYQQQITVDNTENNVVHFSRFGDYANNTYVTATKKVSGNLKVDNSVAPNIGSGAGSCDIASHTFSATSESTSKPNGFSLPYIDQTTSPAGCAGTATGIAVYTKN